MGQQVAEAANSLNGGSATTKTFISASSPWRPEQNERSRHRIRSANTFVLIRAKSRRLVRCVNAAEYLYNAEMVGVDNLLGFMVMEISRYNMHLCM